MDKNIYLHRCICINILMMYKYGYTIYIHIYIYIYVTIVHHMMAIMDIVSILYIYMMAK